jgi:hypothetical protein
MKYLLDCCDLVFGLFTPYENGDALKQSLKKFVVSRSAESAHSVYLAFLRMYRMPGLEPLLEAMCRYEKNAAP